LPQLKIHLLGLPYIEFDDEEIDISRRKAFALLAYLAITGKQHSRDFISATLWSDYEPERARAELRRILNTINKTAVGKWMIIDRKIMNLQQNDDLWIDVVEFNKLLDKEPTPEILSEAIQLYRGDFMRGFTISGSSEFDDWQSLQTQTLQQMLIRALEQLVNHQIKKQEIDGMIASLQRWLEIDPYYEIAQRQLMRAYTVAGQRAAALHQYESFRSLLKRELDLSPQEETTVLYETIKANRPIQLHEKAPPVFGNMPPMPTLIVGRDETIKDLKTRIGIYNGESNKQKAPLNVIQGWPGIGKSTITAMLAHDPDVHDYFVDGVLWTSLGQTPNIFSEMMSWANALKIEGANNIKTVEELSTRMTALLRDKRILLIVDDAWEASHAIPFNVGGQHSATIVTTRMNDVAQALVVKPEEIYKIPILTDSHSLELLRVLAPDAIEQNPDEANDLIHDLEGLPLALQVAGRLLRAEMNLGWGVSELLVELREGAKLLSAQAPVDRIDNTHQTTPTIHALLQKSTDLLNEEIRERFALLGAFAPKPASFDLDAMKAVWLLDDPRLTIRELVERGLLEPFSGRFQMHALLVMHARSMFTA